jgi:hypothetical protein
VDDRWPKHGYAATREGAMAAFVKSWRLRMLDEHHLRSLGKLVVRNLDRIADIDNIRN